LGICVFGGVWGIDRKYRDQGIGIRDQRATAGAAKLRGLKAEYRGLSTARRTVRLSAASVEMTFYFWT
jgi:hypothetical protein